MPPLAGSGQASPSRDLPPRRAPGDALGPIHHKPCVKRTHRVRHNGREAQLLNEHRCEGAPAGPRACRRVVEHRLVYHVWRIATRIAGWSACRWTALVYGSRGVSGERPMHPPSARRQRYDQRARLAFNQAGGAVCPVRKRCLTVRRSSEDADRSALSPETVLSLPDPSACRCRLRVILAPSTKRP
jgi:hypothetical protein